jgi:hypothetical protein
MSTPPYTGFLLLLRLRSSHIDQDTGYSGSPLLVTGRVVSGHWCFGGPVRAVVNLVKGVVSNGAFEGLHETMSLRSTNRPSSPI